MAWYERLRFWRPVETEEVHETAIADYPIETAEEEPVGRNWLMLVPLVVAAIAFAVLVALLASWGYNHSHKASSNKTPAIVRPGSGSSTAGNNQTGQNQSGGVSAANTNQLQAGAGGSTAGAGQTGKSSTNAKSPAQLPNNGPGDVVAIFIGATIAGSLIHYSLTTRRV